MPLTLPVFSYPARYFPDSVPFIRLTSSTNCYKNILPIPRPTGIGTARVVLRGVCDAGVCENKALAVEELETGINDLQWKRRVIEEMG